MIRYLEAGLIQSTQPKSKYDDDYGTITIPWYGSQESVRVIFEREQGSDPPSEKQIEAFCQFISNLDACFLDLEDKLLAYFNSERDESSLDDETIQSLFPQIASVRDLKALIGLPTIIVSYYQGNNVDYIGIIMECKWEIEHGLGIKIVNNQAEKIGCQNIVI